jgi:hypothetical protein
VWHSGRDIKVAEVGYVIFATCLGAFTALVVLVVVITDTQFWNIVIYRRKRKG